MIAERLSEEEIGGLKELFKMLDTDNSGTITFEELKEGLRRVGSELMESEIKDLMDAVRIIHIVFLYLIDVCLVFLPLVFTYVLTFCSFDHIDPTMFYLTGRH